MSEYADYIHPPNVVLVSSNHGSPLGWGPESSDGDHNINHHHHHAHCSPLSSAPNSPNRYITDDDDDDEEEEEDVRPEEVEELLNSPASPDFLKMPTGFRRRRRDSSRPPPPVTTRDVPFDELHPRTTTTAASVEDVSDDDVASPSVVSPFKEEIDEYVEEEEEDEEEDYHHHHSSSSSEEEEEDHVISNDEKKEDDSHNNNHNNHHDYYSSTPPKPNYASYLGKSSSGTTTSTTANRQLHYYDHPTPLSRSGSSIYDEDSVPMDERRHHLKPRHHHRPPSSYYSKEEAVTTYDWDSHRTTASRRSSFEAAKAVFSSKTDHHKDTDIAHSRASAAANISRSVSASPVLPRDQHDSHNPSAEQGKYHRPRSTRDFFHQPKEPTQKQAQTQAKVEEENPNPTKNVLNTAEREVQEMERRVQAMMQRRQQQQRQTSSQTRRFAQEEKEEHLSNDYDDDDDDDYAVHDPPSLSPRPVQVNSSLESASSSSYYYDGSVMGSSPSNNSHNDNDNDSHNNNDDDLNNDDLNNTTINTTVSSAAPAVQVAVAQQVKHWDVRDDQVHDHVARDLSRDYYKKLSESSKDDNDRQQQQQQQKARSSRNESFGRKSNSNTRPASPSFKADFDTAFDNAFDKAFDSAIDNTTRAFARVTDGLASYVLPWEDHSPVVAAANQQRHNVEDALSSPPDSDVTPQLGNLSPDPIMRNPEKRVDLMYRSSDKIARARSLVSGKKSSAKQEGSSSSNLSPTSRYNAERARQLIQQQRQRAQAAKNNNNQGSRSDDNDDDDGPSLPIPPTLHRIAAMIEGLAMDDEEDEDKTEPSFSSSNNNANKNISEDWPSSVSQMMEEYQTAITESLRNLSMEEVAGLAGSPTAACGNGKMVTSGVPIESQKSYDYGDFMAEMTMGGCLQMPQLDHPPQDPPNDDSKTNDYGQCRAGILQYDEYETSPEYDRQQYTDTEHEERAVFARQLSEKLLDLGAINSSTEAGSSTLDQESPEKVVSATSSCFCPDQKPETVSEDQDFSFMTNESSFDMSPPKRSMFAGATGQSDDSLLMVSNNDLPSDQPSASSDFHSYISSQRESPSRDLNSMSRPYEEANTKNSAGIPYVTKPTMVESIDTEVGIAKGDAILSLLCDNSFQATKEKPDSWAWRVREALWRCRDMRRNFFGVNGGNEDQPSLPNRGIKRAQSCPVDVDDVRVVGGIRNVATIQEKALTHLQRDEFEEALELYEDIIFNYYSFFESVLAKRNEFSSEDVAVELSNFKPYIGASLHNLGVIHLLKGDYEDAFSFFKRAVENRRSCLGEDHSDTITSLVRLASCRFAMDNFADAHTNLELALALAGNKARTSRDYCQLGEILNNLGCLSYMCGQPTKAMRLFREALDVQLAVQNSTLYGGSKYAAHSITLNISVVRGNIGFLALVLKDVSSGIVALESALRDQRLMLTGAHVTLVSTMDHLAVANLLEGRTQKALKMLRRIYELQKSAHGASDPRCFATRQKIMTIRSQQMRAASKQSHNSSDQTSKGKKVTYDEKVAPQAPEGDDGFGHEDETKDGAGDARHSRRASTGGSGTTNGSSKNKSLFKAIRSFGRKKSC